MSQNYKTVYYKGDFFNIPIADYNFTPGDYIETKDGKKGYIKSISDTQYPEFKNINIDFGEKRAEHLYFLYSFRHRKTRSKF